MTTLEKVISGGQTGADVGGVLAARLYGLKTGGWMPHGWRTLNGARPEYEKLFDMQEHPDKGYKARTWQNVEESDATIRFAVDFDSAGEKCTLNAIKAFERPVFDVPIDKNDPTIYYETANDFYNWMKEREVKTLNVAGNAHNKWAGMQHYTSTFLSSVLYAMGFDRRTLCQEYWSLAVRGW